MGKSKHGFTLLELSIVLVIIGLIIGGITVGKDLIRSAGLKAVITEFSSFKIAVDAFRLEYNALPGDMDNATSYWGAADGGDGLGSDCYNATVTDGTTCNGNADGEIGLANNGQEWFHAWVQLSSAGLIPGSFTGRRTNDPRRVTPGVNAPESRIGRGGYTLMSITIADGNAAWYSGRYNPMIVFGTTNSNYETNNPIVTGAEAYLIDKKLDDGKPGLGFIRPRHDNSNCVDNTLESSQNTANYNLTVDVIACPLIFSFEAPGT